MNIINTCPHAITIESGDKIIKYESNKFYSIRLNYIPGEEVNIDNIPIKFRKLGIYEIDKNIINTIPKDAILIVSTLVADAFMKNYEILKFLNDNNIKITVPNSSPQFSKRDSLGNIISVSQFILYN